MSEIVLFHGIYKFKNQRAVGIELREPNTRIHIKIDSGPRFDEYDIKLVVGNSPSGIIAKNRLTGAPASRYVSNNGEASEIIWVIGGATKYAFVMNHRSNPNKPDLTVETTLTVSTDKPAGTYPIVS